MSGKYSGTLLLLTVLFFSATATAVPAQNDDVASLVNQRLSYMKQVAGYKAKNQLAIEDLRQEEKVLAVSLDEAERLGLKRESVKAFVQAQMDAAKAIQYRYRADWLSVPENDCQPDSLEQIRTKISILNTRILTTISDTLMKGESFAGKDDFLNALNQINLHNDDKERLWYSMKEITLSNSIS